MTFPEIVKTTLWDIIDEMSRSLSSFVKNPDKDFIRKRKLDFKKMMHLIISMESGSLNHELLKFFEYDSSLPTGSAFYQQRSKLSVSAFRHLLKEFNLKFPLEKFRGKYYLIACDGSEFNIATVYKGNIIKNLIMDCQSYTKYRPNETTGGIFVSWRRKEELPTGLD